MGGGEAPAEAMPGRQAGTAGRTGCPILACPPAAQLPSSDELRRETKARVLCMHSPRPAPTWSQNSDSLSSALIFSSRSLYLQDGPTQRQCTVGVNKGRRCSAGSLSQRAGVRCQQLCLLVRRHVQPQEQLAG